MACLRDDELEKTKFKPYEYDNISKITNLDRNEIDQIITEFLYHKGLHGFLSFKKSTGMPMPMNQSAMRKMITEERPQFVIDIQQHMYDCIKRMLNYNSKFVKKEEEARQKKNSENRVGTNKIKYKKN